MYVSIASRLVSTPVITWSPPAEPPSEFWSLIISSPPSSLLTILLASPLSWILGGTIAAFSTISGSVFLESALSWLTDLAGSLSCSTSGAVSYSSPSSLLRSPFIAYYIYSTFWLTSWMICSVSARSASMFTATAGSISAFETLADFGSLAVTHCSSSYLFR